MASWDDTSYVLSSKYRQDTMLVLAEDGPSTPSEIAAATGRAQPHISRALGELRDRDVVELLVPDDQRQGRYYALSAHGQSVWDEVLEEDPPARLEVADPAESQYADLIQFVMDYCSTDLQGVGVTVENRHTLYYMRDDIRDLYSEMDHAEFVTEWMAELRKYRRSLLEEENRIKYEVRWYENTAILRLFDDENLFTVSIDGATDMDISRFAAECYERF